MHKDIVLEIHDGIDMYKGVVLIKDPWYGDLHTKNVYWNGC